jgi:hypothetical protein
MLFPDNRPSLNRAQEIGFTSPLTRVTPRYNCQNSSVDKRNRCTTSRVVLLTEYIGDTHTIRG